MRCTWFRNHEALASEPRAERIGAGSRAHGAGDGGCGLPKCRTVWGDTPVRVPVGRLLVARFRHLGTLRRVPSARAPTYLRPPGCSDVRCTWFRNHVAVAVAKARRVVRIGAGAG
ncbi:hypothetical protein GCM10009860_10240 [Microbacterium mitrae]